MTFLFPRPIDPPAPTTLETYDGTREVKRIWRIVGSRVFALAGGEREVALVRLVEEVAL